MLLPIISGLVYSGHAPREFQHVVTIITSACNIQTMVIHVSG